MERALAVMFLGLTVVVITFVFYLQANAIGLLYWRSFQGNELTCYYYGGLSLHQVTFHDSQRKCPTTRESW